MTEITAIAEQTPIMNADGYLAKFTAAGETENKSNIENLIQRFRFLVQEQGRTGMLHAVGGTVNKPLPRKDIDVLVTLNAKDDIPQIPTEDLYEKAERKFNSFQAFINDMVINSGFEIEKVTPPAPDNDYPNVPKNDGSITIKKGAGVPIELIVNPEENILTEPNYPAIMLTQVK